MTFYVENESNTSFPFEIQKVVEAVTEEVLQMLNCPYEVQINVLITDSQGIRELNAKFRQIDRETDVLSFPNAEFDEPGNFDSIEHQESECFDPDTGELILGDVILSAPRIREQAASYGHSQKREFAFLTAHSILHLCGFDHMTEEEAVLMEEMQDKALNALGITREITD